MMDGNSFGSGNGRFKMQSLEPLAREHSYRDFTYATYKSQLLQCSY